MLIIQSPMGKSYRYLQVVKNRFSGDTGMVPYRFDPETHKYYELTKREMEALDKKPEGGSGGGGGGYNNGGGASRYYRGAKKAE